MRTRRIRVVEESARTLPAALHCDRAHGDADPPRWTWTRGYVRAHHRARVDARTDPARIPRRAARVRAARGLARRQDQDGGLRDPAARREDAEAHGPHR